MRRTLLGLGLGLLVISACTSRPSPPAAPPNPLAAAPERVSLAGKTLVLRATAWRDFMPISPPGGKPLAVALRVKTVDGSAVPTTVRADTVWVIGKGETWSAQVEERPHAETGPDYEVVAGNGPKWAPGTRVDIVVRLRDASGQAVLLRAPRQAITMTQ